MQVISKLKIQHDFKETFFYKDCSLKFLESNFNEDLIKEIVSLTKLGLSNPKKHITYDIGFQVFHKGMKSCVNTGLHVDGVGNDYLMYVDGDFRTIFATRADVDIFPEERDKLLEFNTMLERADVASLGLEEIPNATLIKYTSKDIHKGREADGDGSRFFLRVCSSDYLIPKNKRLR